MSDTFQRISLNGWRQFQAVDITFKERVTILTGANGSGKTTILNILGRHFGWDVNLVSTPIWTSEHTKLFWTDLWKAQRSSTPEALGNATVGSITYSGGDTCILLAPAVTSSQYSLSYQNKRPVTGLTIPSHRPAVAYASVEQIPTNPRDSTEHFQQYQQLLLAAYGGGGGQNPGLILKQSLIALAVFGYGNAAVAANPEYRELFDGFQEVLRKLLPSSLGFEKLEIRMPDIVLCTRTGDFSLDAMSGGVGALVGIAWQLHMFGSNKPACTVLIDEPENHLHPTMQREVVPALAAAFPTYRFIISTHSPLIVSSDVEAVVYALTYSNENRVISTALSEAELSGSANRILREVLDVQTSVPVWVEKKLERILGQLSGSEPLSPEAVYEEIKKAGLEGSLGEYVEKSEKSR